MSLDPKQVPPPPMTFRYDLFISYARQDDQPAALCEPGWITAFVAALQRTHRLFTPEDLAVFFDREEIRVAQDWELRIRSAVRDSSLLLACLSPNYFASEWCRREWELYAQHELDRALSGEGINPIYFIEAPGFEGVVEASPWVTDLRKRQYFDLRPWYPEGVAALESEEVRRRLELLDHQIDTARDRVYCALEAPGTVDRHNPHFVGRREEMRRLREMLACGTFGVITAVQGLGGIGKTALANAYAHAFASEYGGGRWLVRCEGQDRLSVALLQLATPLRIEFNDLEKKDVELALRRLFAELESRTRAACGGKHPAPACLLILDNVDRAALLAPDQVACIPNAPWLHVVATTRLGHDQLFDRLPDRQFLSLDELPEEDAVLLIRRLQPGEAFASEADREATRAVVRRLGGFTLAVEAVAVYLGLHPEVSFEAFRQRLDAEGLWAPETVAGDEEVGQLMRHRQKQLSAALGPMLEALTPEERFLLDCAALLPPDSIPLPWLRSLAVETYPELNDDRPGYPPRWPQLTRRLLGRHLLVATADGEASGGPRTVRMHRLVQELVRTRAGSAASALMARLQGLAESRCLFLRKGWLAWEARWEVAPLGAFASQSLDQGLENAPWLANEVATWHMNLGDHGAAEPPLRRALEASERVLGAEHPHTLTFAHNLAVLLESKGDYGAAVALCRRALEARERVLGAEHPETLLSVVRMAVLLTRQGDYRGAEPLSRRALEVSERVLGAEHLHTLTAANELAHLLMNRGDDEAAESLLRRVLEASERVLGAEHPETLLSVHNLASLLVNKGDYEAAEPLYRRALDAQERVLGAEHPETLLSVYSLATLLVNKGCYEAAEPLCRRALDAQERVLGAEHPHTLWTVNILANLLADKGDYWAAEPLYRRALASRERVLGAEHPDTLRSVNNIAHLMMRKGDYAAAEPLFRSALEAAGRVLGMEHEFTLTCVSNLGFVLACKGDLAAGEPLSRRALEERERMLGPDHPGTLRSANNLGCLLARKGDYAAAELLLRRALEGRERVLSAEKPETLTSVHDLADLLARKGDHSAAEALFRRALAGRLRVLGPEHPDTHATASQLEKLMRKLGGS